MAQTYLESMLGERERIIYVTRQHWLILARNIVLEIATMVAIVIMIGLALGLLSHLAGLVIILGALIFLLPLATMLRDILNWSNRQYVITNRRVMQIAGIVNKTVSDSSLEKVNDVKMTQTAPGRMFNYGDVEILTASELGVNLFRQISNPVHFKTSMLNAKEALDAFEARAVPAAGGQESIPALIAQLENLRKQGVLSEAEFQAKKAQLLARL